MWGIFWIANWWRKVQPTVDSGTLGNMSLGSIKTAADCVSGSKLINNFLFLKGLCFSSCLRVPALSSFLGSPDKGLWPANQNHPFPTKLLLVIVLLTAAEKKVGHWGVILQNLVSGETSAVSPSSQILSSLEFLHRSVFASCASVWLWTPRVQLTVLSFDRSSYLGQSWVGFNMFIFFHCGSYFLLYFLACYWLGLAHCIFVWWWILLHIRVLFENVVKLLGSNLHCLCLAFKIHQAEPEKVSD